MKILKTIGFCATLLLTALFTTNATAQNTNSEDTYIEQLQTLSLRENIITPKINIRDHETTKSLMKKIAIELSKYKLYTIETMRKGEVVIVTIQTDNLFAPNDTLLIDQNADKYLTPLLKYIQKPGKYKLLLAVHSDDTGSKTYTTNLTTSRIEALYEWFDNKNEEGAKYVFGYPMGDTQPLKQNDTRAHRAANRRLEIFIVPEQGFIKSIKSR